jgi:hypothetical protein
MKINWARLIVGGLIAAIICFLSDGFFHEQLLGRDWEAVYSNLGITEPPHQTSALLYFAIFELGRGFVSMLLYATMRTHFGPGPKTAVLAGIAAWVAFSLTGPAQFIPLGFFSKPLWLKVAALQLVTSIVATIAGAALYKDVAGPVTSPAT